MKAESWAIVDSATNMVVNTVIWDGDSGWSPPEGTYPVNITSHSSVSIGWYYYIDKETFYPNPPRE